MLFLTQCHVETIRRHGELFMRLVGNCIDCEQPHHVDLDHPTYKSVKRANKVSALQGLPYDDREFLIVGRCPKCGEARTAPTPEPPMTAPEPVVQPATAEPAVQATEAVTVLDGERAYVTNSASASVAHYAERYLNEQGYTAEERAELRAKFKLRRSLGPFKMEDIQDCIANESLEFLDLYARTMRTQVRPFLLGLEAAGRLADYFWKDGDARRIIDRLERIIYHRVRDCDLMYRDYDDWRLHAENTGMFAASEVIRETYHVRRTFLDQLGMRVCSGCADKSEPPPPPPPEEAPF